MVSGNKKKGLGRGLSALMADVREPDNTDRPDIAKDQMIPIEKLRPNPDQPRKYFATEALDDLVASIKEKGILQPLIVRSVEDVYEIVAGERRWRAAQQAKLHEVPVLVRSFTDTEMLEVAIIENVQRSDLNPIEEAAGYKQLVDRFGHTQEKIADALGKSRSHIANLLRLLQLPDEVQYFVLDGRLSAGHARALITCDNSLGIAKRVISEGLSVRATEALVKRAEQPGEENSYERNKQGKDADTHALEKDLSAATGVRVQLKHKSGSEEGQVILSYKSLDQLDELCRKLSAP